MISATNKYLAKALFLLCIISCTTADSQVETDYQILIVESVAIKEAKLQQLRSVYAAECSKIKYGKRTKANPKLLEFSLSKAYFFFHKKKNIFIAMHLIGFAGSHQSEITNTRPPKILRSYYLDPNRKKKYASFQDLVESH